MKSNGQNLEDSKLWKQSVALAKALKALIKLTPFPYAEQYTFPEPLQRTAVTLTSDIANAVGKTSEGMMDYRFARGHLFTIKGLLLMAKEFEYLETIDSLLMDIELLQRGLDAAIEELETDDEVTA